MNPYSLGLAMSERLTLRKCKVHPAEIAEISQTTGLLPLPTSQIALHMVRLVCAHTPTTTALHCTLLRLLKFVKLRGWCRCLCQCPKLLCAWYVCHVLILLQILSTSHHLVTSHLVPTIYTLRYLEVRFTYNLLNNCSYNPIIFRVTVVMGFIIRLELQLRTRL